MEKLTKEDLEIVLEDDIIVSSGGVSNEGQTLKEYLDETGLGYNEPLETVNKELINSGIKPIKENNIGYDLYEVIRIYARDNGLNSVREDEDYNLIEEDTIDKDFYEHVGQSDSIQLSLEDLVVDLLNIIVKNNSNYYK